MPDAMSRDPEVVALRLLDYLWNEADIDELTLRRSRSLEVQKVRDLFTADDPLVDDIDTLLRTHRGGTPA